VEGKVIFGRWSATSTPWSRLRGGGSSEETEEATREKMENEFKGLGMNHQLTGTISDLNRADTMSLLDMHPEAARTLGPYGRSLLHATAVSGDVPLLKKIIEKGGDVNRVNDFGETPLFEAARAGKIEVIKELLRHGANCNRCDKEGNSPIIVALSLKHSEIVTLLIDAGCDLSVEQSGTSYSPLHLAASVGDVQSIKRILQETEDVMLYTVAEHGAAAVTPIFLAVTNKHYEVVQLLLEAGTPPDIVELVKNNQGQGLPTTPLIVAIQRDWPEGVRLLLDAGANPNNQALSPLCCAVSLNNVEIMEILLENGANPDLVDEGNECAVHVSARLGRDKALKMLLEYGAETETPSDHQRTALHEAVTEGQHECMQILLENNANPNAKTDDGVSPLMLAASLGDNKGLDMLIKYGGDSGGRSRLHGMSAAHAAINNDSVEVLKTLIDRNSPLQINRANDKGTPLLFAVQRNATKCLKLLLAAGVSPDDGGGVIPPIFTAVYYGFDMCFDLLIEKGADVNAICYLDEGDSGSTALMASVAHGRYNMFLKLLKSGADVNIRRHDGFSTLELTAIYDRVDEFDILVRNYTVDINAMERPEDGGIIYLATLHKCYGVLEKALELGADPDRPDEEGITPLMVAIKNNDTSALQIIIKSGKADINFAAENGINPLYTAVLLENVECVRLLLSAGCLVDPVAHSSKTDKFGETPLATAVHMNNTVIVEMLLACGANTEAQIRSGGTSLLLATANNNYGLMRLLLRAGADINGENLQGINSLSLSTQDNDITGVRLLVEEGADINRGSNTGITPFHEAVRCNLTRIVDYLLSTGKVKINQVDNTGQSALGYAAKEGNLAIVSQLLLHGASVSTFDKHGVTPLGYASAAGNIDLIRLLIESGADPNAKDRFGKSPAEVIWQRFGKTINHIMGVREY